MCIVHAFDTARLICTAHGDDVEGFFYAFIYNVPKNIILLASPSTQHIKQLIYTWADVAFRGGNSTITAVCTLLHAMAYAQNGCENDGIPHVTKTKPKITRRHNRTPVQRRFDRTPVQRSLVVR